MTDQLIPSSEENRSQISIPATAPTNHARRTLVIKSILLVVLISASALGGFLVGRQMTDETAAINSQAIEDHSMDLINSINPPDGYTIPAVLGEIGPKMVAAGAIDVTKFIDLYKQTERPLSDEQIALVTKGSNSKIVISSENAHFLLNFFWAFGLSNDNPILTTGPMVSGGKEKVSGFASVGGWTLGTRQPTSLYASSKMVELTDEQQARLSEVASAVYRPCCNNPTHFPDCNHGMAMLGLLELMASQNFSTEEMFNTAKYVNAFWYPQQMLEVAIAYKAVENKDFKDLDAKTIVSKEYFSSTGYQQLHAWLSQNGLLGQSSGSQGSCGVR